MSTFTIPSLTAANSIDATADQLAIYQPSIGGYRKIARTIYLGITGSPVGTSDSQVLTNKTIGNTNTVTVKDANFTLQDDGDTTKQVQFQLSGLTTSSTRTLTIPDASTTLVGTATTQTLTNKTITSPTISGGTIDNSTITVDAISGHTSATVVTVANLQISNGVLNTNNSVITANLADGAVTPAKLVTGTGSSWAFQTWSPSYTNLTVGNGTVVAHYVQTGKKVDFWWVFTLGSTSVIGTGPTLSLPVTASSSYPAGAMGANVIGTAVVTRQGTGNFPGILIINSTTIAVIQAFNAAGTYLINTGITATVPATWAATDVFAVQGSYEAA